MYNINKERKEPKTLLIVWTVLLLLSFLCLIAYFIPYFNSSKDFMIGMCGVFMGLYSGFFIAWLSDVKILKDINKRKNRIRNALLKSWLDAITETLNSIIIYSNSLEDFALTTNENDKYEIDNIKYNLNLIFQLSFIIYSKKLENFSREEIQGDKKYIFTTKEYIDLKNSILTSIQKLAKITELTYNQMNMQNTFDNEEIFSEKEISIIKSLLDKYKNDNSDSIILTYPKFDKFFDGMKEVIDYYGISYDINYIEKQEADLLNMLESIPQIHNEFYDYHKDIRSKASEFLNTKILNDKKKTD